MNILKKARQAIDRWFYQPASNPWSRDDWSLTEQCKVFRRYGEKFAVRMAAKVGAKFGDLKPLSAPVVTPVCGRCIGERNRRNAQLDSVGAPRADGSSFTSGGWDGVGIVAPFIMGDE